MPKTAKAQRNFLKISLEEVQYIFDRTGAQSLEQYICLSGSSGPDFAELIMHAMQPAVRANELLNSLKEMWLECNVLRRAAIYVRQTFADVISKTDLCDSVDENSKIARSLLLIDCVQAKGLRKHTNGRLISIEQAVLMFIEREAFKSQGLAADVE